MLNKQDFKDMEAELRKYDSDREELIKETRELLKLSKRLIYSVHRRNEKESESILKEINAKKGDIDKHIKKDLSLLYEGSYSEAMEEYSEAMCYHHFVKSGKIPTRKAIGVNTQEYLMGMCDLTGELVRRAVALAVKKEYAEVKVIKRVIEDIFNEFLKFDLRNGNLRRKSDSIKYNLKKIEEIVYDIREK